MQNRLTWAQAACSRILRPLVRLALGMGLKHPQLETLLRDLLLDEARRYWQDNGIAQPNISLLAVTTGLNRKDVTQRVRQDTSPLLLGTGQSAASKTFTLWMQLASNGPRLQRLPVVATPGAPSFESVARQATRGNVHHRAVLDELVRLGMAVEAEGHAHLLAEGFVPSTDLQTMLAFLGDSVGDHLSAAIGNTVGATRPPLLERSVYANGLSLADCERLNEMSRDFWNFMHKQLVEQMGRAVDAQDGAGTHRIRVGIYTFYEEDPSASAPAPAEASTASSGGKE